MATGARDPALIRPKATRRTPEEVRELLLGAARALFAARGFAGASTRDIALKAGVSEALLFRHFGTKAKLFERAILDPLNEFVHAYVEEWRNIPATGHDPESVTRGFIDGFYRLLSEHRELVMALVTAQAYESLQEVSGASPLTRLLEELETLAGAEAAAQGFHFDVPVATRVATGMVMGMALLDEWLFQPGRRKPSRQRIVDEMVAFMLHGLAHRDQAATPKKE
ncbi:MAG: TetR/AcrR family transcriptional regulator [Acidimicrobiia bacterium]